MSATRRFHPALLVVCVTFLALLFSAGLRSAPGVMMIPIEVYFGWDRSVISFAAALGLLLYGLVGPFAAALMINVGIKRTILTGLALMAMSTFASQWMTTPWQYVLTWGVLSGIGSGAVASVLGAAVVNRWFASRQGLVMGFLSKHRNGFADILTGPRLALRAGLGFAWGCLAPSGARREHRLRCAYSDSHIAGPRTSGKLRRTSFR